MANEILKLADAQAIFDSAAKAYQHMLAAVGTSAAEASTLAKSADNFHTDILTHVNADSNLWLATDVGGGADAFIAAAVMGASFMAPWKDAIMTLERHVVKRNTAYTDINDWMVDIVLRVHPYCRTIYNKINATNTWPLTLETTTTTNDEGNEVVKMATFTVSGAAAGTLSATTDIDTTVYGDTLIKLQCTKVGGLGTGGGDLVVTINGADEDGSAVTGTGTITNTSAENAEFEVATTRYASISSITLTNGSAADTFDVIARDDRAPTL